MEEYGSEAVVLAREPHGEQDSRVSLFTRRFGKMTAKAKSARKITSKLAAHLEPGNVSDVRLIEKGGVQVVDALKRARTSISLADLAALDALLHEAEPDPELWRALLTPQFSWQTVLRVLGWDPAEAQCDACGGRPAFFRISRQDFFCSACASRAGSGHSLVHFRA